MGYKKEYEALSNRHSQTIVEYEQEIKRLEQSLRDVKEQKNQWKEKHRKLLEEPRELTEDERLRYDHMIGYCLVQELQRAVDDITAHDYEKDECPPDFRVGVMRNPRTKIDSLTLTVTHMRQTFTEVIFPQEKYLYGYPSLAWEMEQLYNRTM